MKSYIFNYTAYISKIKTGCKCLVAGARILDKDDIGDLETQLIETCPYYNTPTYCHLREYTKKEETIDSEGNVDFYLNGGFNEDASNDQLSVNSRKEDQEADIDVTKSVTSKAVSLPLECKKAITLFKYEMEFGKQDGLDIKDTVFYKQYLSKFNLEDVHIEVPAAVKDDFEWDILYKLLCGSLSSEYHFFRSDNDQVNSYELNITVNSGNIAVTKAISELWSFQIFRLYEIYIEENMNLFLFKHQDFRENRAISFEQEIRFQKHLHEIEKIMSRNNLLQWISS